MRAFLVFVLLLAFAWPTHAAVYRCRDRQGVLVLTDDPENFPSGCRPEGKQGEQVSASPASAPAPAGRSAREVRGEVPGARTPSASQGSLPAGSGGVPPGLNRPDPFTTPEEPAEAPPSEDVPVEPVPGSVPETPLQENSAISPQLQPWMEEARVLHQEFREMQTDSPADAAPARMQELEARIEAFLSRVAASGLSPEEQEAVERALPPPAE